ncbi:MAG TPA: hypothetical protein VK446_00095 [Methylocystis sp.]|nr:hypothetical protein [Methylocystis sp.]
MAGTEAHWDADTSCGLCEFLVIDAERVVIVAPSRQFLQIPKNVSIGALSPRVVNWAQIGGDQRPQLVFLLELRAQSISLDGASVAILPNLPKGVCGRMRPESFAAPSLGSAILSLLFKTYVGNSRSGAGWSNIIALAERFDIESRVSREANGKQMTAHGPHFTFRTVIDRHSLPSGLIFGAKGGRRVALPVDLKLTSAGMNGRSLAEIRAWAADDDAESAMEANKADSFLMLEGGRATRVKFA